MSIKFDPKKAGQPHVAIVLLWYPLFTQPFIFKEVESLNKIAPVEVYTLYGRNLRHCSAEMKNASSRGRAYGTRKLLSICWNLAAHTFCQPRKTWRLLKRSVWRKWPNLETFGENLWGFCVGISLAKQFKKDGIDFVYSPWPRGAATAAWVGATIAGLPFGVAARGDNLEPADPDLADKLAAASIIRANNAADQKRIEDFSNGVAKGKIELIYNSLTLTPSFTKDRFNSTCLRMLALGRFDVTKGFDTLLKTCSLLKKKGFAFKLTLAGGGGKLMGLGGMDKLLYSLRKDLDLESEVSMPGLISHDELPEIIKEHDLFVAPCVIDPSGRRDGIPNTVIEAMAFGMPVITTNINALPEIVRDGKTGLTVAPSDPQALAEAIIRLSSDPDFAMRLGKNGAAFAAKLFDPELNAVKLANMFKKAHSSWKGGQPQCAA